MEVRSLLEKANADHVDPKHLYNTIASTLSTLVVLYQKTQPQRPLMTRTRIHSSYVVVFTDLQTAQDVKVEHPENIEMVEEPALPFLIKTYRDEVDGIVINPGHPSRYVLERAQLHALFIEYAVLQCSLTSGAWVPTQNESLLIVEYQSQKYTVPIYCRKEDAAKMCEKSGGEPILQPWNRIFAKAQQAGAKSLFLHFNLPEQQYLSSEHVSTVWHGKHRGYVEQQPVKHPFSGQALTAQGATEKSEQPIEKPVEKPFAQEPVVQEPVQQTKEPEQEKPKETNEEVNVQTTKPEVEEKPDTAPKSNSDWLSELIAQHSNSDNTTSQAEEQQKRDSQEEVKDQVSKTAPPTQSKPIQSVEESEAQNEERLPQRENPYSLKNKQSDQLEFYRGQAQQEEEPISLLPQEKKPSSEQKESSSVNQHQPQSSQSTYQETKPSINQRRQKRKEAVAEKQTAAEPSQPQPIPNQGVDEEIKRGLNRLEEVTVSGEGMANPWDVCQILAELRRIWVIVDGEGNMVILAGQDQSPIVDFFTSDLHAQRLIDEAHESNPNLPKMKPQLVSTKKLYRALASRQPIVWINRGSPEAWTSVMGDTLPYVMQLMSQLQK